MKKQEKQIRGKTSVLVIPFIELGVNLVRVQNYTFGGGSERDC